MKKTNVLFASAVAFILLVALVIVSCEEGNAVQEKVFFDPTTESTFSLDNQVTLNQLAITLAKEEKPVTISRNAAVVDLTDIKGNYKAISVEYTIGESITNMIVPIFEASSDAIDLKAAKDVKGKTYYLVDPQGCEMKCTQTGGCNKCTQEITERCKSQTCSCDSPSGGCEGSITFPAN